MRIMRLRILQEIRTAVSRSKHQHQTIRVITATIIKRIHRMMEIIMPGMEVTVSIPVIMILGIREIMAEMVVPEIRETTAAKMAVPGIKVTTMGITVPMIRETMAVMQTPGIREIMVTIPEAATRGTIVETVMIMAGIQVPVVLRVLSFLRSRSIRLCFQ